MVRDLSRWEEELPNPEELMPLTQSLITPDLAFAFDIPTAATSNQNTNNQDAIPNPSSPTVKKPRLVWTPQLHRRFVEAVAHIGIKNAVPKTIMQLMNVDGLTRENVASHLQKYRLYLKRMQQHSSSSSADAAADRLFATAPIPSQFLGGPFVPIEAMQQYRPMAAAALHQNQYYNRHNRVGMMAVPPLQHPGMVRMNVLRPPAPPMPSLPAPYAEEVGSGDRIGRRVLTLFPSGED